MKLIYLIATLDTKEAETLFLRRAIEARGGHVCLVDAGCLGDESKAADVSRAEVHAAAGNQLDKLAAKHDRGAAIESATKGVAELLRTHHGQGRVAAVISLGGSAGTAIGTAAMRVLPLGVPKFMVSTMASGQVRPYVGDKDVVMMNSIVDIAGINRISRMLLSRAAAAIVAMSEVASAEEAMISTSDEASHDRPLIAASMFGVTTPCVQHARHRLEAAGYEVLVFHATGNGGQAMESLIADGVLAGVLDITTTELADELVGGVLTAGPDRLTAAGRAGIPQVVSVGATDMVNFGPPETVPDRFAERRFYQHNPSVTLMRTTPEENAAIGREVGRKLAEATGPTALMLPLHGVSAIDQEGAAFDDAEAREQLFMALRDFSGQVEIQELPLHINDPGFADRCVDRLLEMLPGDGVQDS